ncbi:hypothetical protein AB0J52_03035 [Spirillospora sp. NPDC049652]
MKSSQRVAPMGVPSGLLRSVGFRSEDGRAEPDRKPEMARPGEPWLVASGAWLIR